MNSGDVFRNDSDGELWMLCHCERNSDRGNVWNAAVLWITDRDGVMGFKPTKLVDDMSIRESFTKVGSLADYLRSVIGTRQTDCTVEFDDYSARERA